MQGTNREKGTQLVLYFGFYASFVGLFNSWNFSEVCIGQQKFGY